MTLTSYILAIIILLIIIIPPLSKIVKSDFRIKFLEHEIQETKQRLSVIERNVRNSYRERDIERLQFEMMRESERFQMETQIRPTFIVPKAADFISLRTTVKSPINFEDKKPKVSKYNFINKK